MNALYNVSEEELKMAQKILEKEDGVVNLDGVMGERKTERRWAKLVAIRETVYQ